MAQNDWKLTSCSHNIFRSVNSYAEQLSSMFIQRPKNRGFPSLTCGIQDHPQDHPCYIQPEEEKPAGESCGRFIWDKQGNSVHDFTSHAPGWKVMAVPNYKESMKHSLGRATSQVHPHGKGNMNFWIWFVISNSHE